MEVQQNLAISAVVHTSSRLAAAEFMSGLPVSPRRARVQVSHVSLMKKGLDPWPRDPVNTLPGIAWILLLAIDY